MHVFDEITAWPKAQKALLGLIFIPIVAVYAVATPLALVSRQYMFFADFFVHGLVATLSMIGCLIHLKWPTSWTKWIPSALLGFAQAVIMVIAKPPSEWIYAAPSYIYSVGAPVLSIVFFARYGRAVGIHPSPDSESERA